MHMGTLNEKSTFLFAEPSFVDGMARIFDFAGSLQLYNESKTPAVADRIALTMDWLGVGGDIRSSLDVYEQEEKVSTIAK